ncbi:MAG: patatin-like phospholipase family protein [Xanthomonadaceae bacterium]|jgi:predicted acylesterase/phospholipase RssA|nr:patatin-like phospholipase family protein [Xanthomonadaceae bacterium]
MLLVQPARPGTPSRSRIGLAIAGGGPTGGMYELGALRALERAIEGLDLTRLEVYVGVSSGAFLAAGLANRLDTAAMCRVFLTGQSEVRFHPGLFLRPALAEYLRRAGHTPTLLLRWAGEALRDPGSASFGELLGHLGGAIPNGLFDNEGIERFLRRLFTSGGRSNDFRELERPLFVVAVDLDSGKTVRFGAPGWDDVPISRAVQASAALPGLYPPVCIRDHHFVDGALRRTMHASIALDRGVDLLLGINPFVPFDASGGGKRPAGMKRLAEGGLPLVLSQTFRTLLQSRVQVGLEKYARQYPDTDQLVMEPDEDDGEMFFTSVFSYRNRLKVCEYAFRSTLRDLHRRREQLAPLFARHGLRLRTELLDAGGLSILDGVGPERPRSATTARLHRALDLLQEQLAAESAPPPAARSRGRRPRRRLV